MSIMPAQPPARILGDQDDMWGQYEPPKLSQRHLDAIKKSSPRCSAEGGQKPWRTFSTLSMEGMEEHPRQCFCRANLSVEAASVKRMTQNSANISVEGAKERPQLFLRKGNRKSPPTLPVEKDLLTRSPPFQSHPHAFPIS